MNIGILLPGKPRFQSCLNNLCNFYRILFLKEPPIHLSRESHAFLNLFCLWRIGPASSHEWQNQQIAEDVRSCVKLGRTPVILTRYKEQAKWIYENVRQAADQAFLLYGGNTDKENEAVRMQIEKIPRDQSMILVATGQKIGEGFDCPRLDTLMPAAPVSYQGRLEQYVGRLNRDYEGKQDVVVYD